MQQLPNNNNNNNKIQKSHPKLQKACVAFWEGTWSSRGYEHHLLAVLLLTGCKLQPTPPKLQLHGMTRGTVPALGSIFCTNSQTKGSRNRQIIQQFAQSHPASRRGTWCLPTWACHPDALSSSLTIVTVKDAPSSPFPTQIMYFGLSS